MQVHFKVSCHNKCKTVILHVIIRFVHKRRKKIDAVILAGWFFRPNLRDSFDSLVFRSCRRLPQKRTRNMANVDVFIQNLVFYVVVPSFIAFIAWQLFQDQLSALKKQIFAYLFHRSIHKFNEKLGPGKQKLFADLSDFLRERTGSVLEIAAGGGANFQFYPDGCTVTCLDINKYSKGYLEKCARKNSHFHYNGFIVGDARNMQVGSLAASPIVVQHTRMQTHTDSRERERERER